MSDNSLKRTLEILEGKRSTSKLGKSSRTSKNPFMREPSPPKITLSSTIKSRKKSKQMKNQIPQPFRPKKDQMTRDRIKLNPSKTEENIKKLLMFSSPVNLDKETTQKLIKRAQTQKYVIPEPKSKEEQATAFTDEDFLKFEKEYFCS